MKRTIIFIALILNTIWCLKAQGTSSDNEIQLYKYLEMKEGKISWMIVEGLTCSFSYPLTNKKIELKNGVYYFRSATSTAIFYIFTFHDGKIDIVNEYNADSLLDIYKKEKKYCKSIGDRLRLLEKLLNVLAHNENIIKREVSN